MPIETLEDIIEEIADRKGIYGACPENGDCNGDCRPQWTARLTNRILAAVEVERRLSGPENFYEQSFDERAAKIAREVTEAMRGAPTLRGNWRERLRGLAEGWDRNGAPRISEKAISTLESFAVVPCSDGGIQLEVHHSGLDIEIIIGPSGAINIESSIEVVMGDIAGAGNTAPAASILAGQAGPGDAPPPDRTVKDSLTVAELRRAGECPECGSQQSAHRRVAGCASAWHTAPPPSAWFANRLPHANSCDVWDGKPCSCEAEAPTPPPEVCIHRLGFAACRECSPLAAWQPPSLKELQLTRDLPMALDLVREYSDEVWRIVKLGRLDSRSKLADITLNARSFLKDLSSAVKPAIPELLKQAQEDVRHVIAAETGRCPKCKRETVFCNCSATRPGETCNVSYATLPTAVRCQLPLGHPRPVRADGEPCHAGQDESGRIVVFGEGQPEAEPRDCDPTDHFEPPTVGNEVI